MTGYPNDRSNPAGAIPIYLVAGPGGGAIPVNFLAGATGVASGPIPVRVVAGPGTAHGSDQSIDANAVPAYEDGSGMPVWLAAGIPPLREPINQTAPSISPAGIVTSGVTLTADPGIWDTADSYMYQWTRNGANIAGMVTNIYTTGVIDRNTTIGVKVVASNAGGDSLEVSSSNTVYVENVPVNVIAPVVSPSGPVMSGTGLMTNQGTWTNNPTAFYYGWMRNGATIPGASMNGYLTVPADEGALVSAVVLATNTAGSGAAINSSNSVAVVAPAPVIDPNQVISCGTSVTEGQPLGVVTASNNPTSWTLDDGNNNTVFTIDSFGVVVSVADTSGINPSDYPMSVSATNSGGTGSGSIILRVS